MVLGVLLGTKAVSKISQSRFKTLVLWLILASGGWTLLAAIKVF
jgi:uncharacterized membrane protein YfcA